MLNTKISKANHSDILCLSHIYSVKANNYQFTTVKDFSGVTITYKWYEIHEISIYYMSNTGGQPTKFPNIPARFIIMCIEWFSGAAELF